MVRLVSFFEVGASVGSAEAMAMGRRAHDSIQVPVGMQKLRQGAVGVSSSLFYSDVPELVTILVGQLGPMNGGERGNPSDEDTGEPGGSEEG